MGVPARPVAPIFEGSTDPLTGEIARVRQKCRVARERLQRLSLVSPPSQDLDAAIALLGEALK